VDCRVSSPSGRLSYEELEGIARECGALLGEDSDVLRPRFAREDGARAAARAGKTPRVAETATGGLLANAFTEVCGACKFFAGGVVCYSNDSKMQLLDVPECLLPNTVR
jgi:nicotinamide-nucleotide amidase